MYTYNVNPLAFTKSFHKYDSLFITLRGVFLAIMVFCASFLAPYIGCNYQRIMKLSPYVRYFMLYLVIFFSINLGTTNTNKIEHPMVAIGRSIFVFFIFILLNNLSVNIIIITMVFFAMLVLTAKYYEYYEQTQNDDKSTVQKLQILQIIQGMLVVSILIMLMLSLVFEYHSSASLSLKSCSK